MTVKPQRYPKDRYGWKHGLVFSAKIHKFRDTYIVETANNGALISLRKYKTLKKANDYAISYLKIKKSKYWGFDNFRREMLK
jgi:hypothetical protein